MACPARKCLYRLFILIIILMAVVGGIWAISRTPDKIIQLALCREFFEVALPVLGFGALIKYLLTCPYGKKSGCCCKGNGCGCACHGEKGTCGDKAAKSSSCGSGH